MKLHLSPSLALPLELAARTQCIVAQKGAGKTYTAKKETEEMLEAGLQVCCLDPTGVWWGLRSSADGKGKGFPILVMGGNHADVPLEPSAGEIVANFVVESGQSVILDMSAFESNAAQDRFAEKFAETLYRLKSAKPTSLHLMIDEADSFAPQSPMPGQRRMLGAFEAIVRRGRSRGLGMTLITQRPAVLNKNLLSQADLLVCLRVVGTHDHKALQEWVNLNASKEQHNQFMASLPSLQNGEGWFWSPGWLGIFERTKIGKCRTFDSSKTPEPGQVAIMPKLAPVDLEKLTSEIKATVQRIGENDPAKLRAKIAHLERELAKSGSRHDVREKFVLKDGQLERVETLLRQLEEWTVKSQTSLNALLARDRELAVPLREIAGMIVGSRQIAKAPAKMHATQPKMHAVPPEMHNSASNLHNVPSGGMKRIMIALAQRPGLSARQIGVRAGLSSSSGTFSTYVARMRSNGWIDGGRDSMQITDRGLASLGSYDPLPTGKALYEYWRGELGGGAARMLQALYECYPRAISKEELGGLAGIAHSSGTFSTYLSRLRALELVTGTRELAASAEFFE